MVDKYRKYSLSESEKEILQKAINILCNVGSESCHEYPFRTACMIKDIKDGIGFNCNSIKNADKTDNQLSNYRGWVRSSTRKMYANNLER